MSPRILITGGAGYVGSSFAWACRDLNWPFAVIDDLSVGSAACLPPHTPFLRTSAANATAVGRLVNEHGLNAIAHFAASTSVEESLRRPHHYHVNNAEVTRSLIDIAAKLGVERFLLVSTAAVYGSGGERPIAEERETAPINPYGLSKLRAEQSVMEAAKEHRIGCMILRCFNIAGAELHLRTGRRPRGAGLMSACCDFALGASQTIKIYGGDRASVHGPSVRDFVHVTDVVDACTQALMHLSRTDRCDVLNCGSGHGRSVIEVIGAFERLLGRHIPIQNRDRQSEDPVHVVANIQCIREQLGWTPRHSHLDTIVKSELAWARKAPTTLRAHGCRKASGL